uniref:ceramide kinase isoform X2 n=1 Tax=Myxine glutinosa TaxID=7769 RepID=UPI00358DE2B9
MGSNLLTSFLQVKKRRFVVSLSSAQLQWNEVPTKGGERGDHRAIGDEGLSGTVVPLEEVVAVKTQVKGNCEAKDACYALSAPSQCEAFTVYHIERQPGKRWALQHVTFCSDDDGVPCHRWIQTLNKHVAMQDNVRPQRLLVFINPVGGRCRGEEIYRRHVDPIFKLAGIDTDIVVTQQANHAKDYILNNNIEAFDGILSVGGDGTFSEIMHGVIEKAQDHVGEMKDQLKPANLRLGIIPAGSTDCVCFTTMGTNDPVTAALHVVIGDNQPLDVCEVRTDEAFLTFTVTLLGYGFYGDMLRDSENHRWLGASRYDIFGFKTFLRGASYTGRVDFRLATADETGPRDGKLCRSGCDVCKEAGERLHSQSCKQALQPNDDEWMSVCGQFTAINLSTMSCSCARCPSGLSPSAHLAGGSADLVLVRACSRSALLRFLIRHTAQQDRFDFPFVETYRVSEVRFTPIAKKDCDECEEEEEDRIASSSELCRRVLPQATAPGLCCCHSFPQTLAASSWNCDGEILMQTALNVRVRPRLIRLFARGIEA